MFTEKNYDLEVIHSFNNLRDHSLFMPGGLAKKKRGNGGGASKNLGIKRGVTKKVGYRRGRYTRIEKPVNTAKQSTYMAKLVQEKVTIV